MEAAEIQALSALINAAIIYSAIFWGGVLIIAGSIFSILSHLLKKWIKVK